MAKRGKISNVEKEYIEQNSNLSPKVLAEYLDRSIPQVLGVLNEVHKTRPVVTEQEPNEPTSRQEKRANIFGMVQEFVDFGGFDEDKALCKGAKVVPKGQRKENKVKATCRKCKKEGETYPYLTFQGDEGLEYTCNKCSSAVDNDASYAGSLGEDVVEYRPKRKK